MLDRRDLRAIDHATFRKPTLIRLNDHYKRVRSRRECPGYGDDGRSSAESIAYVVLNDESRAQPALLTSLRRIELDPVDLSRLAATVKSLRNGWCAGRSEFACLLGIEAISFGRE